MEQPTIQYSPAKRAGVILAALAITVVMAIVFFPDVERLAPQHHPKPDILLVTFDTVRADHCSSYGYARKTTPNLDRLAAEGVRFENAYAPMATTAPSHATLLTSFYPLGHGVIRNGFVLPDRHATLAERLKSEGYTTAAFVSSFVLFNKFGLDQGFDLYDDDFTGSESTQAHTDEWEGQAVPGGKTDRRADSTTQRAIAWLDAVRPARRIPLFVWVHYMDPHEPYDPPKAFSERFLSDAMGLTDLDRVKAHYDGEIAFADENLGRLVNHFERKGLRSGSVVIVTADHGEAFVEHGWRGHGPQIYEEAVRVPMLIRWKGHLPGGKVFEPIVGLHDIAPTVLSLIGADTSTLSGMGADLWPALAGARPLPADRPLFFQRRRYDEGGIVKAIPLRTFSETRFGRDIRIAGNKFAVRSGRWKYYEAADEAVARELYDLVNDPREKLNVVADHPDVVTTLSEVIESWRASHRKQYGPVTDQDVSAQDRAMLEALGYVDAEPEDE